MLAFLKERVPVYHIIEYDKSTRLPELSGDLRESLKTLENLPAFQYLLQRFRVKKAAMESTLREGFNLTEQQLRYCQAGIYWSGEIERDIKSLTQARPQTRSAEPNEQEEFERVSKAIELIGQE